MKTRCYRPTWADYERYGGRGIIVCERWKKSFVNFLEDMGPCPPDRSLDRIDNNGNYEPSNCRWATRKEQTNNRSCNIYITHEGVTLTATQWPEKTGIHQNTIRHRFKIGWPPEKIFAPRKQCGTPKQIAAFKKSAAQRAAKTHCKWGHPFDEENTSHWAKNKTWRGCKKCNSARSSARRTKND